MAIKHWRDRNTVFGASPLIYNTANAKWVSIRAWSQYGVGNSNLQIVGVYYKPFHYVRTMKNWDKSTSGLLMYYPLCDPIYDGPVLTDAATYTPATHNCIEAASGFSAVASGALVKTSPLINRRNGFYQYAIPPGVTLRTPAGTYYYRSQLQSAIPFMVDFVFYFATGDNYLMLDTNDAITNYAGIYVTSTGVLQHRDYLGNVSVLASGLSSSNWYHFGLYWNGATFFPYLNGVAQPTVARATIAYGAVDGAFTWNYSGGNYITHPAIYYNVNGTGFGAVDYAGMFRRHYEDLFFNYKIINPLVDSGPIAPFTAWSRTFTRDTDPGIPDQINVNVLQNAMWYYDIQMETEE